MKKIIAVFGGRNCSKEACDVAYKVGKEIALAGAILICGGKSGVMEAACKGSIEHGGIAIGILPDEEKSEANPYVTIPIATGMGAGRNIIIARTCDCAIAIDGSYGTLSEIAHALSLGKPVISLLSWDIEGVIKAKDPEEAVRKAFEVLG
ncbi:MAG TPA: TIGR00725 family protein [Candidatus Marinimicrobia bacterium]|nr:TIGR00725 family protein [Candidatus Neomarinimicrobiota bacterium]